MSHTPGPWTVITHDNGLVCVCASSEQQRVLIASVGRLRDDISEILPDAHLIAAAPDLLALHKRLIATHTPEIDEDLRADIISAIARAEGKEAR